MKRNTIYTGDCRRVLAEWPENSVDAVVTDPPYGLGKEPDMAEVLRHWLNGDDYKAKGGGFMGKTWDSFVPGPSHWKSILRVMKPGAYMLAFGGTRTYDMMVTAMRLSGFEIRDQLQWIFAQGFPKSLNVSKEIDRAEGTEPIDLGKSPNWRDSKRDREKYGKMEVRGKNAGRLTTPATDKAKLWDGWGSALKPACEPVCLARKPLSEKTIAGNVLKWGTGALNIDACRIGYKSEADKASATPQGKCTAKSGALAGGTQNDRDRGDFERPEQKGRWPANILLDEEAARILDEQSGDRKSGAMKKPYKYTNTGFSLGRPTGSTKQIHQASSGGASRFFYTSKAGRAERNENLPADESCTHPCVKPIKLIQYLIKLVLPPGGVVLDPFLGSGTLAKAARGLGVDWVGVELDPEYVKIAEGRISGELF